MIVAVLDACVLYPPSLRDILMWQATVRSYSPRFTEEINAEWVRNVLADNSATSRAKLERTCRLMEKVYPRSLVSGYEVHIPTITLLDPDDRHVLAAAIHSSASYIVTYNLSDFPASALDCHNVSAIHPDIFLSALFDNGADRFLRGVRYHRSTLKNPPKSTQDYIDTLRTNRLFQLATRMEVHRDAI
jgi:predicted nucleic acid-binding protein